MNEYYEEHYLQHSREFVHTVFMKVVGEVCAQQSGNDRLFFYLIYIRSSEVMNYARDSSDSPIL